MAENGPLDIPDVVSSVQKETNSDQPHKSCIYTNPDPWTNQRWCQVPRRSNHPFLPGQTRHEPYLQITVKSKHPI
jgi:hypothetical protein